MFLLLAKTQSRYDNNSSEYALHPCIVIVHVSDRYIKFLFNSNIFLKVRAAHEIVHACVCTCYSLFQHSAWLQQILQQVKAKFVLSCSAGIYWLFDESKFKEN